MFPFLLGKKPQVTNVPHPELTPLYDDECEPSNFSRNPMLSYRDYSTGEIERAKAAAQVHGTKLPADMREYCHNNGINWQVNRKK